MKKNAPFSGLVQQYRFRSGFISQEREVSSGFCQEARHDEEAYSQKSVTEEQRSVRAKDTETAPPDLMKPLLVKRNWVMNLHTLIYEPDMRTAVV